MNIFKKFTLSKFVIVLVFISVTWINFNHHLWKNYTNVIKWDVISYYQYLPAIFHHKDAKMEFVRDNWEKYKYQFWPLVDKENHIVGKTSIGLAMLYLPFYLIAWLQALFTGQPTNGFSSPFAFWILFSSLFYLIIGLIFLRKFLLRYFSDNVVAFSILSIFFGTNLLWYTSLEAPMSHSYQFALFSIFLYLNLKWHENINFKNSFFLGLILGLITIIRPTNLLIIIIFLFYRITSFESLKEKFKLLLKNFRFLIIIFSGFFLPCLPQMILWKYVTGNFIYYTYGEESFFFLNPQIIKTLFSYRKGLFIYTPIILFAFLSIFFLLKNHKEYFLPVILFTILNVYVISSWYCWWYGGTYAHRGYIESFAILIFPFSLLIEKIFNLKNAFLKYASVFIIFLLIIHQIFQTIQFNYRSVHYDSMTKEAYWDSFLRVRPSERFESLLKQPDYVSSMYDNNLDTKPEIISTKRITIKSYNGNYLCVDAANNFRIMANKQKVDTWEIFLLQKLNNGNYALKGFNDKYVTAFLDNEEKQLSAYSNYISAFEQFDLIPLEGYKYAFKTLNGSYLTTGSDNAITANAKSLSKSAIFEIQFFKD